VTALKDPAKKYYLGLELTNGKNPIEIGIKPRTLSLSLLYSAAYAIRHVYPWMRQFMGQNDQAL
jgi:hypothetical protein